VGNWIKVLGGNCADYPRLALAQAWLLTMTLHPQEAEAVLAELDAALSSRAAARTDLAELRGEMAALRGLLAHYGGDSRRAGELCRLALELLPESANPAVRATAAHVLGEACRHTGDFAGCRRYNTEAARLAQATGNMVPAISALSSLGDLMVDCGELREAARMYDEALALVTGPRGRPSFAAGRVYVVSCRLLYEWDDLVTLTNRLRDGIAFCRQGDNVEYVAAGLVIVARERQARGDLDGAQQALDEAGALALTYSLPRPAVAAAQAQRAMLWLAQGDLAAVIAWAGAGQAGSEAARQREAGFIPLIHVRLILGDAGAAIALARDLLAAAEASGRMGRALRLRLLLALALRQAGDVGQARGEMERALAAAQPEGFVRSFVDEGPRVRELLVEARAALATRGDAAVAAYAGRLLAAFPAARAAAAEPAAHVQAQAGVPLPAQAGLVETLSDRELEVLRLVAEGKSNQEIAGELVVVTGTVKRHLNNIFGKLGVSSRTQAVARARELGLI
jgi:LuxR family transcriptional regulator, maltose regulon positive regulatory protein